METENVNKKITDGEWAVRFDYEIVAAPTNEYPYPRTIAITHNCQLMRGISPEDARANTKAIACLPDYQNVVLFLQQFLVKNPDLEFTKEQAEDMGIIIQAINEINEKL